MTPASLILASGSPRRRQMLSELGLNFEVQPVDIDESPLPQEPPADYVLRLARQKAQAAKRPNGAWVLAADTIVALDDQLLGKPRDPADAAAMLRRLAGRGHQVLTGVALHGGPGQPQMGTMLAEVEVTQVWFAQLSEQEIDWYVSTGEPLDKAGAYGIQGLCALFIDRIDGNYSNVVGLPLPLTYRLLQRAGLDPLSAVHHRT